MGETGVALVGVDNRYIQPWLEGKGCNGRLLQLTDPLDRPTYLGPDPPAHHGSVPLDRPTLPEPALGRKTNFAVHAAGASGAPGLPGPYGSIS